MGVPPRLVIPLVAAMMGGCVSPGKLLAPPAPVHPAQVVATWNNKVVYVPDPARGGVPAPGLGGRVYLFGPTLDFPVCGDGALVVDLFDDTTGQPGGVHLEQWQFDPETLKRLLKKDMIGDGYTLFLPWGTYRADIRRVHVNVRYETAGAVPVYSAGETINLDHGSAPGEARVANRTEIYPQPASR